MCDVDFVIEKLFFIVCMSWCQDLMHIDDVLDVLDGVCHNFMNKEVINHLEP